MYRVGIFTFDGATLLDVSGPADVFHHADSEGRFYSVELVSRAGGTVRTSSQVTLADTVSAAEAQPYDTLIVAGGPGLVRPDLDPQFLSTVAELSTPARRVASVCTGAFVLAGLGYLNGRRATTHWRHSRRLARWFPHIAVEADVIHTRDGRYMTSAGVSAGIDLALAMVEHDLGADTAREVARELVMFLQRPGGQSQFSSALTGTVASSDPLREVMDAVVAHPGGAHTVTSMAAQVGVSTRHLNRLFKTSVGLSPTQWLEKVRVDAARGLILQGYTVTKVAIMCGFGTDETLRQAFARQLGTTPTAFRERFATTAQPQSEVRGHEKTP